METSPYNPGNRLISGAEVEAILKRYGVTLKHRNISLYRKAFIHRSYCVRKNENVLDGNRGCPDGCLPLQEESNERMEFLGDAVINLVIGNYMFRRYPDENEGFLTRMRTKLVNGIMLAHLSKLVRFGQHLVISQHIESNNGRCNVKLLEDCFEAFVGAMYSDFNNLRIKGDKLCGSGIGYQVVEQWLICLIEDNIDFSDLINNQDNHKERLIRFMQTQFGMHPRFVVASETETHVTVAVKKNDEVISTATAETRKSAENLAACNALMYYGT